MSLLMNRISPYFQLSPQKMGLLDKGHTHFYF